MNVKRIARIVIDVIMLFLFIFEMTFREGRKVFVHGLLGTSLFVVFAIHLYFNFGFYKTFYKGKFSASRIFLVSLDLILSLCMLIMFISSLMISGMSFSFMPFYKYEWIIIHKGISSWTFILMSLHLGLHTKSLLIKLEKWNKSQFAFPLVKIIELVVVLLGIYFFAKSRLWSTMLFFDRFVYVPSIPIIFLQYVVIVAAFLIIVRYINLKLTNR